MSTRHTITVVNVKSAAPGTFVYCGRYNAAHKLPASPLANPFKLTHESEREACLAKYVYWLTNKIADGDKAVCDEIMRLADLAERGDLTLGCWCAPLKCHCDVIAAYVRREVAGRQARAAIAASVAAQGHSEFGRGKTR